MLRKNLKITVALLLAMLSAISVGVHATDLPDTEYEPILRITMGNPDSRNASELWYSEDMEGNLYGAEDFAVDGSIIYVLNSSNNTVLKYEEQRLVSTIDVADYDITATMLSADNGNLYILGTDLSVVKITENGTVTTTNYAAFVGDEAVTDFIVDDNTMYISTPEGDYDTTYAFELLSAGRVDGPEIFEGRYFDNGITYIVDKVGDNKSYSKTCTVTVIDGNSEEEYTFHSDYWITGAVFLGYDENQDARIKVIEVCSDEDYNIVSTETIRTVSSSGDTEMIYEVPAQYKSIINPSKVIDGELYHLSSYSDAVELTDVAAMEAVSASAYESPLDTVALAAEEANDGISLAASSITRSQIMSNAASYHSSFSWTCTSTNLSAMTNWTKPRYIGSAGTYTCMPYCWGGFSNRSQFTTGLSNGGRVGNINTSTGSHVSNTYGLDCSGYVSRCWGLAEKYGTWTLSEVSYEIAFSSLKQGDALNDPGSHVMLFDEINSSGNYVLYESTTLNSYDKVAHTIRGTSSVENNYTPIRFNNVSN